MPYSAIEKQRIMLRAKLVTGKVNRSRASDKRIFMSQCIDNMTSSGEADSDDDARDICEMLWDEGEELDEDY